MDRNTSPRTSRDLTLSGFVASAIVSGLLVGTTYWMSVQETRAQGWITHTQEVLAALATTRADLVDIQNGTRGFVVSGKETDLQPYEAARTAIEADVQHLRALTADNPVQQEKVRELAGEVALRLASAAAVVEARRTGGFEAGVREAEQRGGRHQMAGLRELLHGMEAEESRLLAQRWELHQRLVRISWATLGVLLVGLLVALSLLYRLVRRKVRAEQQVLEGEQQFHAMTDSVTDYAILKLDAEGHVRTWNTGAQRIKGYAPQEILGRHFSCFYTPEDMRAGVPGKTLEDAASHGRYSGEGWRVRKDGSRFWASVSLSPLLDPAGNITGYVKVTRDLTERKEAEEQLQRLNTQLEQLVQERTLKLQASNEALLSAKERLQALSARLISAQEEERRHIARELHDETGQALTLIRIQLTELAGAGTGKEPAIAECIGHVDRAISHIRGLSLRLRPPMLDDLGLSDALEWVVEQQSRAAGWRPHIEVPDLEERLPAEVETACFRICQEALTNAARHAHATEVDVRLHVTPDRLELVVADNGDGFDLDRYRTPEERQKHFGLVSMTERAMLAGGGLDIETSPGRGTRITAVFQLTHEASEQADEDSFAYERRAAAS